MKDHKTKYCPHCGHRIKQQLYVYSSGDGSLSASWRWDDKDEESSMRPVTKADLVRYLKTDKSLMARDWMPIKDKCGRWKLARYVKRTGSNRLRIGGQSYYYSVDNKLFSTVEDGNLVVAFKMRVGGVPTTIEVKNMGIRMVIRYFLNHEKKLVPFFKDYISTSTAV